MRELYLATVQIPVADYETLVAPPAAGRSCASGRYLTTRVYETVGDWLPAVSGTLGASPVPVPPQEAVMMSPPPPPPPLPAWMTRDSAPPSPGETVTAVLAEPAAPRLRGAWTVVGGGRGQPKE